VHVRRVEDVPRVVHRHEHHDEAAQPVDRADARARGLPGHGSFICRRYRIAGAPYAIVAAVLGALVLGHGLRAPRGDSEAAEAATMKWARDVFLASIAYVPILFATMVVAGTH